MHSVAKINTTAYSNVQPLITLFKVEAFFFFLHFSHCGSVVYLFPWLQLFINSPQPSFSVSLIPIRYLKSSFGDLVSDCGGVYLWCAKHWLGSPSVYCSGRQTVARGVIDVLLAPFQHTKRLRDTRSCTHSNSVKYHALSTDAQTELALTEGPGGAVLPEEALYTISNQLLIWLYIASFQESSDKHCRIFTCHSNRVAQSWKFVLAQS